MKKIKIILLAFTALLLLPVMNGCDKKDLPVGTGVEFYTIEKYEALENGGMDESKTILGSTPFIRYSDIISYNSKNYTFKVKDNIAKLFDNFGENLPSHVFVVKVNNQIIYEVTVWPAYLSLLPRGIYIEPSFIELYEGITVKLINFDGKTLVPDNRNDERILSVLRKDGKLIE